MSPKNSFPQAIKRDNPEKPASVRSIFRDVPIGDTTMLQHAIRNAKNPDSILNLKTALKSGSVRSQLPRTRNIGLALSGGGSRGDFGVGVCWYLYSKYFNRPTVITGTSVGAVNGSLLAEGDADSIHELRDQWLSLDQGNNFFQKTPWLSSLLEDIGSKFSNAMKNVSLAFGDAQSRFPMVSIIVAAIGFINILRLIGRALSLLRSILQQKSIFNLEPTERMTRARAGAWSLTGPGLRGTGIAIGKTSNGATELFARSFDDRLVYCSQASPGADFSKWVEIEVRSNLFDANSTLRISAEPVLIADSKGKTQSIIVRTRDKQLFVADWNANTRSVAGAFAPLGQPPGFDPSLKYAGIPSVSKDAFNNEVVAAVYGNSCVRLGYNHSHWDWFTPARMGHKSDQINFVGNLSCARDIAGNLVYVARDFSGKICISQGGGGWSNFDGKTFGNPGIIRSGNHLVVYYVSVDGAFWTRVRNADGSWEPWANQGGEFTSNISVVANKQGKLSAIGRGKNYELYLKSQRQSNGEWEQSWDILEAPGGVKFLSDPICAYDALGQLEVFAIGKDQQVWRTVLGNDGFEGWESLGGRLWPGVQLRFAMVSLDTGKLKHVNESGVFENGSSEPIVDRVKAIIASSALPTIFPPVKIGKETYVDGGVRSFTPIAEAINAGAELVFAVVSSCQNLYPHAAFSFAKKTGIANEPSSAELPGVKNGITTDFSQSGLVDIAMRTTLEVMVHHITETELHPINGWPKSVVIIRPSVEIHDRLTIDPALVRIAIDYGYMRASDILDAPGTIDVPNSEAQTLTDTIVTLRKQIAATETEFAHQLDQYRANSKTRFATSKSSCEPDRQLIFDSRNLRRELLDAIRYRLASKLNLMFPEDFDGWYVEWSNPAFARIAATPWDEINFIQPEKTGLSIPAIPRENHPTRNRSYSLHTFLRSAPLKTA